MTLQITSTIITNEEYQCKTGFDVVFKPFVIKLNPQFTTLKTNYRFFDEFLQPLGCAIIITDVNASKLYILFYLLTGRSECHRWVLYGSLFSLSVFVECCVSLKMSYLIFVLVLTSVQVMKCVFFFCVFFLCYIAPNLLPYLFTHCFHVVIKKIRNSKANKKERAHLNWQNQMICVNGTSENNC